MDNLEVTEEIKNVATSTNKGEIPATPEVSDFKQSKTYQKAVRSAGFFRLLTGVAIAAILGVALIYCCKSGVQGLIDYKNNTYKHDKQMTIKGYATEQITSDLISWSAHYEVTADTNTEGYKIISEQKEKILKFMKDHGVQENEIIFSSISLNNDSEWGYDEDNNWVCMNTHVILGQTISIDSSNVDLITEISRNCTELISQGINIESHKPEYQYTKLDELKMSLLGTAAEDALKRAGIITEGAGGVLGSLSNVKLSNISITPLYDDADSLENWGYYGKVEKSLATKEKEVTVTVSCTYDITE